jgi:large subunit ribosomal protein L5e
LKKLGLDEMYTGTDEANGKYFLEEREDEPKNPFSCILDVGLRPTTTGARVYAAMKGAVDGGLAIPHGQSGKQFPGWRMTEGRRKSKAL